MVPVLGLNVHVTAVLLVLFTVAVNCCVCPAVSVVLAGLTDTATAGVSVITAVAFFVESAELVAVTVTVCWLLTEEGAVYSPEELMLPVLGLSVHFTAVLLVLLTVAVNCCF